jgi:hypothetical protein
VYTCGYCGNFVCDPDETCVTCPAECGACPTSGNGTCDLGESCTTDPADCGACASCGALHTRVEVISLSVAPAHVLPRPYVTTGRPDQAAQSVKAAATASGGTAVAWAGTNGVNLSVLDASGNRVFSDRVLNGSSVEGLAVTSSRIAVLYDRFFPGAGWVGEPGADVYLAQFDLSTGALLSERRLVGGCNVSLTQGCEIGAGYSRSSILWNGQHFIVYLGILHNWGAVVGVHEGDTLRYVDLDGQTVEVGWVWGCSHSYEQRLALGTTLTATCLDDFSIRAFQMWVDSPAIYYNSDSGRPKDLGSMVPDGDTSWVIYGAQEGSVENIGLARIQGDVATTTLLSNQWLTTTETALPRLAPFQGGLLAGWATYAGAPQRYFVQPLDASGSPLASPSEVPQPFGSDFFAYPNGDVGWVYGASPGQTRPGFSTQLNLVRLRACN